MAKQAVDKTTQELPSMWVWEGLEEMNATLERITKVLNDNYATWVSIKKQMLELEAAGINYAGTTWKNGKYLYLVYPVDQSGHRKREYVGADDKRIKEELAKLENGKMYDYLKSRLKGIEMQMTSAVYYAGQVLRSL